MKRTAIAAIAAALVLMACSGNDHDDKASPTTAAATTVETSTAAETAPNPGAAEMSDVVGAAARAVLNLPGLEATRLIYDENGALTTTSWLDWRPNGDLTLIVATTTQIGGIAQVAEQLMTATSSDTRDEPWTIEEPPLPAGDPGVAINYDLTSLAAGGLATELAEIPSTDLEIRTAATDDGGTRWTAIFPHADATATREWTIDADGRLRKYLLTSDSPGPLFGGFATAEFHFEPLADPSPIGLPEVGADLDVAFFDLPEDLLLPGQ